MSNLAVFFKDKDLRTPKYPNFCHFPLQCMRLESVQEAKREVRVNTYRWWKRRWSQTKHNKWIVHKNRSSSVKWHIFFHGLESEESRTLPGWASEAVFNIVMRGLISLIWSITVKLEANQGNSEKTHDCNFCENKSGSLSKPLNNLLSYGEISTDHHLILYVLNLEALKLLLL